MEQKIKFPQPLNSHFFDKVLIIAPEKANWLVLESKRDYDLFRLLHEGRSISECLNYFSRLYGFKEADKILRRVLTEIVFKKFYNDAKITKDIPSTSLILYLTNACNLRCRHCYLKSGERLKNELNTEEWKNTINQFCDAMFGQYITLTGGEVLLRKDFHQILDHAYKRNCKIQLLTNGLLLDEKKIKNIIGKIYEIQISLDGPSPQVNDLIRGKGTFNKILRSLHLLIEESKDKRIRICIGITPTPETLPYIKSELSSFLNNLSQKAGRRLIVRIATDLFEGRYVSDLSLEEKEEFRTTVKKIYDEIYEEDFFLKLSTTVYIPNRIKRNCGFSSGIKVFPNGDCYPCDLAFFSKVGNIRQDSLKELKEKLYEIYEETAVENSDICKNCDLRYFCGGGCKINNYRRNGDPLIPYCNENTKLSFYEGLIKMNKYFYESAA